jgi:glycine betaine/proline transport system substrate-binding protein
MTRIATILGATALSAPVMLMLPAAGHAQEQCGEVSITEMNWASAQVVTAATATFLLEHGYGCDVSPSCRPTRRPPSRPSRRERRARHRHRALAQLHRRRLPASLEDQGRVERVAEVLDPGGVEGWWIPAYLAEQHPGADHDRGRCIAKTPTFSAARFNNCPDGWGCRIVNDNLIPATMDLEGRLAIEVFNHGSGETLGDLDGLGLREPRSRGSATTGVRPSPLGQYDMVRVDLGEVDMDIHARNQNPDAADPGVSDFPAAPVLTSVTADLADREPQVVEFLSNMAWETDTMSALLAWQAENNASAEEAAVYFLRNYQDTWSAWLNDAARENLSGLMNQG